MSSQKNKPHHKDSANQQFKDEQINDLMKSIQNKLSMLACEDSVANFQLSKLESPKRQYLTATNQKKNQFKMNINDLETSNRKQKQSALKFGQSRIVDKINEMQQFYMNKIQQISSKLAALQFDVEQLNKENEQLRSQNTQLKHSLNRRQKQQSEIVNHKIQQLRMQLIQKFSKQSEHHFQQHLRQMKVINQSLLQERGKRKYLEQEITLLKTQKNNLEQFYRQLLDNHRNLIKLDIQKSQKNAKDSHHNSSHQNRYTKKVHEQDDSVTNKKSKRKQKSNLNKKTEELTHEEMIPFLAKGIKQLKDKLKIK